MTSDLRRSLLEALAAGGGEDPGEQVREHVWEHVQIDLVDEIDSTNTALLERARTTGDLRPRLLMAWRQTQGRGRAGRPWAGEPGASLTWSWAQVLKSADWSGLSLAVGTALADALDPGGSSGAPRLVLKWPNDLWIRDAQAPLGGRKAGGILIETVSVQGVRLCVVGVGLNVRPLPEQTAKSFTTGMGCLQELDARWDAAEALLRAAPAVAHALALFEREGFAAFQQAFDRRDVLRGRPVVTSGTPALQGTACGVAADGALLVRMADGQERSVVAGEVSVRPSPVA